MSARVVVVGGGYAGIRVAIGLDDTADVVLVEPKDSFFHHNGALRAVVDPQWAARLVLPYDRALRHGRIVRDRAIDARPDGVTLQSGERLAADFVVLATGSEYPFPAKPGDEDTAVSQKRLASTQEATALAERVLILGAGPVGLELAGEITSAWPQKQVIIVDIATDVIPGDYSQTLREEIRAQLAARGVSLVLGAGLTAEPTSRPGTLAPFVVATHGGTTIKADTWFRCFGVKPVSNYLGAALATARTHHGHISVNEYLQVDGHDTVFAIGDVVDLPEPKMAGGALRQAAFVIDAITGRLQGEIGLRTAYEPSPRHLVVPLGPSGGAGQRMGRTDISGPEEVSQLKGRDLLVDYYAKLLNRS